MAITQDDIITLDLDRISFHRSFMNHSIGEGDIRWNRFGVKLLRGGQPVDVSLVSCIGYFLRDDGETVIINGGMADSEGVLSVILPQSCYAVEGQFTLALKVTGQMITNGGVTGTVRVIDGVVVNVNSGSIIDPGTQVPELTIQAIVAKIAECEAAAQSAWDAVAIIESLGLYVDSEGFVCQRLAGESE